MNITVRIIDPHVFSRRLNNSDKISFGEHKRAAIINNVLSRNNRARSDNISRRVLSHKTYREERN